MGGLLGVSTRPIRSAPSVALVQPLWGDSDPPAVKARCRPGCDRILSYLKAHPTVTALNIIGSNHRPDGKDSRPQIRYEITPRPGSYRLDQHRWTGCKCGADSKISGEKLEAAYLRAVAVGRTEVVFGVDVL